MWAQDDTDAVKAAIEKKCGDPCRWTHEDALDILAGDRGMPLRVYHESVLHNGAAMDEWCRDRNRRDAHNNSGAWSRFIRFVERRHRAATLAAMVSSDAAN